MCEIMNSPKGVKSGLSEREHFLPPCGTRHDLPQITKKQSYVTNHSTYVTQRCFVNKVCMTTI